MTTAAHAALAELDLARTYARSLHLAKTERQQAARLATCMACLQAARAAGVAAGMLTIVAACDELATALRAAVVQTASLAA
jgi:hypothetical protein